LVNFFKTKSGVVLVASQALQPFETSAERPKLSVLSLYKDFTPEDLETCIALTL